LDSNWIHAVRLEGFRRAEAFVSKLVVRLRWDGFEAPTFGRTNLRQRDRNGKDYSTAILLNGTGQLVVSAILGLFV
jgi:hypothetical protein